MKNIKELLAKIEQLEARVKELEGRKAMEIHYHTHYPPYQYVPYVPYAVTPPSQYPWTITCGGAAPVSNSITFSTI